MKKFDTKTILILVLFGLLLLIGYKWYFSYDDNENYKTRIDELHQENEILSDSILDIGKEIKLLEYRYDSLCVVDSLLQIEIGEYVKEIAKSKNIAKKSMDELNDLKFKLAVIQKKIEDLKNNPPHKTDEELLNSIKNKI